MALKHMYGEFSKTEELEDGTLMVHGIASSESQDSDGEVITADAMKSAIPDYMKFGAVREMHQPKAAGTAISAEVQEDGTTKFCAHIVDSEAVKKVLAGVYKGFSVGGRVTARDTVNKTTITGLRLVEVSLVDRPANPEAVITCYKADGIDEPEAIEKGMYSLSDFACILSRISDIAEGSQYESEWEGDNSPVPAQLREWLAAGIAILKAMTEEETAEMLANLKQNAGEVEVVEMAAKTDLEKAGARNSKTDADKIQAMHDTAVDLGATCSAEKHEHAEIIKTELVEIEKMDDADLEKVAEVWFQKFAEAKGIDAKTFTEAFEKMDGDLKKSAARIEELEAMPSAPKGSLLAVSKGEDLGGVEIQKIAPVLKHDGTVDEELTAIKSARANPIRLF
jgi:hypothetical protein